MTKMISDMSIRNFNGKLYLTGLKNVKMISQVLDLHSDIIVSIMQYNPELDKCPSYSHIKCIYYYAEDNDDFDISIYFEPFLKIINDNPNKVILVHCEMGVSRSATLIASYLIKVNIRYKTRDVDRIIEIMKKYRSIIDPNNGFIAQLKTYRELLLSSNG